MKNEITLAKADEPRKCACGKTKNVEGNCDGSHAS